MKEIAEGIIVFDNPFGGSNITSITSSEGSVVVDASLFPSKAEQIKVYLKRLMNSDIQLVINTHYHPDHTFGNIGFQSQIACSESTEDYFFKMDKGYIRDILSRNDSLQKESIQMVPPAITFKDDYTYTFGKRKILLERVGGHTPDSTIIRVPEEKVYIVGDLVVSGFHPEIVYDSDLDRWIDILKRLRREDIRFLICGHGEVSSVSEISKMIAYLERLILLRDKRQDVETILEQLENDPNFKERMMVEVLVDSLKHVLQ